MRSLTPYLKRKVVVLHGDAPLVQAARAMADQGIGCVLISDYKGKIIGILTDRDLACDGMGYSLDPQTSIDQLMSENPVSADKTADLSRILELMSVNGVRRIPIMESEGSRQPHCVGLVTFDDLIASGEFTSEQLAGVVRSQILRLRKSIGSGYGRGQTGESLQRSESRTEQTLHRFYHHFMKSLGAEEDHVESISNFILSSLVRRLHYTAADHFISQLPRRLQDELLDLPAGPDRRVNVARMVNEIQLRFNMDEARARKELEIYCQALKGYVGEHVIAHVLAQLPEDFREMFRAGGVAAA